MATINDIAEACGVSAMTVSRALNNPNLVAETTRNLIIETSNRMGYIPHFGARSLSSKKTNMIGLVVPDIDHYYADIIKRITQYLESHGYGVLLCNYNQNPKNEIEYLHFLLQGRVDGIILFAFLPEKQDYDTIIHKIPIVFAYKIANGMDVSFVGTDNYKGSMKMMEHIITKGYKRIGAIYSDLRHRSMMERFQGYKDALAKHGLAFDPALVQETKLTYQSGYDCAEQLIEQGADSIFAFNDVCAVGVLRCCQSKGIDVPGKLGVAGFDNLKQLRTFGYNLTTIDYHGPLVGEQAADVLLAEITDTDTPKKHIVLEPQLVLGETL